MSQTFEPYPLGPQAAEPEAAPVVPMPPREASDRVWTIAVIGATGVQFIEPESEQFTRDEAISALRRIAAGTSDAYELASDSTIPLWAGDTELILVTKSTWAEDDVVRLVACRVE